MTIIRGHGMFHFLFCKTFLRRYGRLWYTTLSTLKLIVTRLLEQLNDACDFFYVNIFHSHACLNKIVTEETVINETVIEETVNEETVNENTAFEKTTLLNNIMQFVKMFCFCMFLIILDREYHGLIRIVKKIDIIKLSNMYVCMF